MLCALAALLSAVVMTVSGQNQAQVQQALLLATLQRNPALLQQLRSNPAVISQLQRTLLQQQKTSNPSQVSRHNRFSRPSPSESQQCSQLKKQNAKLKKILRELTDIDDGDLLVAGESVRSQREFQALGGLRNQAGISRPLRAPQPSLSVKTVIVTPTPTWTTLVDSSVYKTVVTQEVPTEIPLIIRGSRMVTTIIETQTQTVTATEVKTSSKLITPSPTLDVVTVTVTPRRPKNIPPVSGTQWTKAPHLRRPVVNGAELADVLEVGPNTTPSAAKSQLDRLKQAYGLLYSNSAQRSKERFGGLFSNAPRNPIFGDSGLDYDYVDEFDQQGLAAQARPVFQEAPQPTKTAKAPEESRPVDPSSSPSSESTKVYTLYFSGKSPGEYTTRLTTVTVSSAGSESASSRKKRHVGAAEEGESIEPTRVRPILMTAPPSHKQASEFSAAAVEDLGAGCTSTVWLESSMQSVTTSTTTLTETTTVTETISVIP